MARDTGADASIAVEWIGNNGYLYRRIRPFLNKDEENWVFDPEKIEAGKSDVQPMVVDENEFGEACLFKDEAGFKVYEKPKGEWHHNGYGWEFFENGPVREFDEGIKGLTERRGDVYGHPKDDFQRIIQMQKALDDCDDEFARHIMNMICIKMSRLVKTPDHSDSWLDIVGYVRTWFMIKEKKDE